MPESNLLQKMAAMRTVDTAPTGSTYVSANNGPFNGLGAGMLEGIGSGIRGNVGLSGGMSEGHAGMN